MRIAGQRSEQSKERDEKQTAKKKQRLQPVVEAAMKRKVHNAPEVPDGYTITSVARKVMEQQIGKEGVEKFQQAQATGEGVSVMDLLSQPRRKD